MWGLIFHCKCVFKCQSFSQSTVHLSAKTLTLNASTISNETLWLSGYKHAWAFNEQWKLSESLSTCMSAQTFPIKPLVLIIHGSCSLCVSVFELSIYGISSPMMTACTVQNYVWRKVFAYLPSVRQIICNILSSFVSFLKEDNPCLSCSN